MYSKITQLCNLVNETEWSALLFFKAEGHPIQPETLECTLVDLFLQDIGTPGYTAFKNDPNTMMDLFESKPELMDCRMGIIHSHHNMSTFYSGTDMDELFDNSNGIDFYLSVVVNNRAEWVARVIYQLEEIQSKISWRQDGEKKEITSSGNSKTMFKFYDLNVLIGFPDNALAERVKHFRNLNQQAYAKKAVVNENPRYLPQRTDENVRISHPKEEEFESWKKGKNIPNHVDKRQTQMFSDRTLGDEFEDRFNEKDFMNGIELEEEIVQMVDIAMCCISIQVEENRNINQIVNQLRAEISEEEVEIYIDEVFDNIDQMYTHHTGLELSEFNRASLYREMIALSDNRNCLALNKLVKALKREIITIKGI